MASTNDITVCYLKDEPRLANLFDSRIKIIKVPFGLRSIPFLRRLYKRIKPDVIHTHCPHADFLGLFAATGLKIKKFTTIHNIWIKWNWNDNIIFYFYRFLLHSLVSECRIIAISSAIKEHLVNRINIPEYRIHLEYNCIPDLILTQSKEGLRLKLGIKIDDYCMLFIGRLEQQKSVDTLIKATETLKATIPNIRTIIIGHGRLKDSLIRQAQSLNIASMISFIQPVVNPEEYYAAADVFVLPSIYEGFGIVILEAFRAGLPVVATNIEGPLELIQSEVNGLLFKPKDYQALADHIFRLYNDPLFARRIGIAGREKYLGKYDIVNYVRRLTNIYTSMNQ
jgi:glycosyltransferase involved in cell wall biosynthesis